MTLQYSNYKSSNSKSKSKKNIQQFKQIEITVKKNGVIRIELIPPNLELTS
jgi:hypothetical protein